ncbi:MAG: SPASM domain-containing protein [Paludibacteraceae bacterium]|nr:SPASM domain-containing protein [Paludibacteraceae bacterium]
MSVAWRKSRFINALRCYAGYALSLGGHVRVSHGPVFVSVEPASVCQLHCPECPVAFGANGKTASAPMMPEEVWQRTLAEISPYAFTVQFYFQGEPLLHKALPEMIRQAHAEGLYTIVSTNAQALTPNLAEALVGAGLSRIIVSMDGLTQETYSTYRIGGSLQQCTDALRYLRAAKERRKARITIELQCLRLRTNEHEWDELKRMYRTLGADRLTLKTAQLYNYADGHPLMPADLRYSRYIKGSDGHYHRKPRRKKCLRVWSGCVITTEGEVLPCCYDKAHAHAYGNIMNTPIRELFANDKASAFRRQAWQEQPSICRECWK